MAYTPLQMANAFIQAGELTDALDALVQHLADQPDDDVTRRLLIGVRLRIGSSEALGAALADFEHLTSITAGDHTQRSIILERLGDLDSAEQAAQQARSLDPNDAHHVERLLYLWTQHGKIHKALELVRTQPQTWRWLQWEGDLLVQTGDDTTAADRYGLALAQIESRFDVTVDKYLAPIKAYILIARAHAFRRLDQTEQADNHYLDAAKLIPDEPTIPFYRGMLAFARGDVETAATLCRDALTHASEKLRAEMLTLIQNEYPELIEKGLS